MRFDHGLSLLAAAGALALAGPAHADVKAGVDAWSAGDYAAAVKEWREPANKGDADAQFNLAQAYRLGRGVPQDTAKALELYGMAAKSGHIEAADHYGLMLFQGGRRQEALPYVQAASDRGDPRAQYLLGIAYFNGDFFEKDWVRAYALMTLANSTGLPQAAPAMAQMDQFIPLEQRQQGAGLATRLKNDADAARASQLAAADLGVPVLTGAGSVLAATSRIPRPVETIAAAPSSAAAPAGIDKAKLAVAEAAGATGADSPTSAGADYARPVSRPPALAVPAPKPSADVKAAPSLRPGSDRKPVAPVAVNKPAPAPEGKSISGPWQLRLGAFSVPANADKMWRQVSGRPELSGKTRSITTSGKLTLLSAAGFASKADAEKACAALKRAGNSCLVSR
jgi:hypothetical protein